jgi:chromosome segregation ATPase
MLGEEDAEVDSFQPEAFFEPPVESSSVDHDTSLIKSHLANKGETSEQLMTLGVTIKTLREDRELLLQQIEELENKKDTEKRDHLSMKADLDEKSIEVSVMKRRYEKKLDLLKVELDIGLDKKALLESRTKMYETEIEKLNNKVRIDLSKVKMRERELENKLEMLRSDSESQIRNRDLKILELKRKIDTLEFDLESVQTQGQKVVSNKYELEEKMEKVIDTLRGAIGDLEEDGVYTRKIKNIKKNLDV